MKSNESNLEGVLLDLLMSGLGAIIILFLIFSLNIYTIVYSISTKGDAALPNIGDASLYSKDTLSVMQTMSSIRFVTIEAIDIQSAIPKDSLKQFWDTEGEGWKIDRFKKLNLNKQYDIELKKDAVTFYFQIDHVFGDIDFQLKLKENKECKITSGIIEGASTIVAENLPKGIYGKQFKDSKSRESIHVKFRIGSLRKTNLISID